MCNQNIKSVDKQWFIFQMMIAKISINYRVIMKIFKLKEEDDWLVDQYTAGDTVGGSSDAQWGFSTDSPLWLWTEIIINLFHSYIFPDLLNSQDSFCCFLFFSILASFVCYMDDWDTRTILDSHFAGSLYSIVCICI